MPEWTTEDIADQSGRTFVITGGNSGIGYEAALELAKHGANVMLACRNAQKAEDAAAAIAAMAASAASPSTVETLPLDLSDLASIRAFVAQWGARPIDVLINNAGIMVPPLSRTEQGFELQFGVNHLGHFLLTSGLINVVGDRVVTVSSSAHSFGRINFDDLNWRNRRYQKWAAYGQSKLANLLFTYELSRKLEAAGSAVRSLAVHPGYATTNLQTTGPSGGGRMPLYLRIGERFAQSAAAGALPTLRAATDAEAYNGDHFGPHRGRVGDPIRVPSSARSRDQAAARRLWQVSEDLVGEPFRL